MDGFNSRLLLVEHKVSAVEDEQELLREGHITLMAETKRLKAEDNTLHTFCKELTRDVTKIQQDIVNMKGSYEGFHHSRCIVVNNSSLSMYCCQQFEA